MQSSTHCKTVEASDGLSVCDELTQSHLFNASLATLDGMQPRFFTPPLNFLALLSSCRILGPKFHYSLYIAVGTIGLWSKLGHYIEKRLPFGLQLGLWLSFSPSLHPSLHPSLLGLGNVSLLKGTCLVDVAVCFLVKRYNGGWGSVWYKRRSSWLSHCRDE